MIYKSDVTIVIPTMDSERNNYALNECLTSLEESGFPMKNIIIAMNGPFSFSSAKELKTKLVWVEEQGQCKAVNAAVATVNTKWVMVSNDDMIYPPDWFERLTQRDWGTRMASLDDDDIVCVSAQLVEPNDGAPTFKKKFFGGVGGDWNKNGFLRYVQSECNRTLGNIRSGFNLPFLIKKEVWDSVGGYDVNYDPWSSNSDSDFEYKLKLAGINMYQNTNCPVYHFSQTSGTFHPDNRGYW